MAKDAKKQADSKKAEDKTEDLPLIVADDDAAENKADPIETSETKEEKQKWHYPQTRCPRCGVYDSLATSTQGKRQYRQCQRPTCRHKFVVVGIDYKK